MKFFKGDTLFPCSPSLIHFSILLKYQYGGPQWGRWYAPSTFLIIAHADSFFSIFFREIVSSLSSLYGGNTSCIPVIMALETWCRTCSSPRRAVCSHYLVWGKNSLLIVGIWPILNKELKIIFLSDRSDRTCVYS